METKISFTTISDLIENINSIKSDLLLLIVDKNVYSLYKQLIFNRDELVTRESKKIILKVVDDGEKLKDLSYFNEIVEDFLSKNIHRNSHIVAIGGGVTSDFAGFIASTLLRGVAWSVVPTTLLSMVDASIGGKVAINSKHGKNLIGNFHLPQNVFIGSDFLKTLPEIEMHNGYGEIIKYSFLSKFIYDSILVKGSKLDSIINMCANYKHDITEKDFSESGVRKILNYGHTFGHALEKVYNISHGIAVIWGIWLINSVFDYNNMNEILLKLLDHYKISLKNPVQKNDFDQIIKYILKDKKSTSNKNIEVVLCDKIGEPQVISITHKELRLKLEALEI